MEKQTSLDHTGAIHSLAADQDSQRQFYASQKTARENENRKKRAYDKDLRDNQTELIDEEIGDALVHGDTVGAANAYGLRAENMNGKQINTDVIQEQYEEFER